MKANFLFQQLKDITIKTKICTQVDYKSLGYLKRHTSLSEAAKTRPGELLPCLQHQDMLLQRFCETCNIPICSECETAYHSQHTCVELTAKAKKTKLLLIDIMEDTKRNIKRANGGAKRIRKQSAKIKEDITVVKQIVSTTFRRIHEELKNQEEDHYFEIKAASQQASKELDGESGRVDICEATLRSIMLCGEKLIEHGKPSDYLMTVPLLVKQLTDHTPDYYDEDDGVNSLPDVNLTDLTRDVMAMKVSEYKCRSHEGLSDGNVEATKVGEILM